ncbi:hypothetical protein [Variovorax sp.]|uniref:hypothetical protein n=1 Tax=Variovorax sp. TaxID=1871043 RepID=UPI003BA86005
MALEINLTELRLVINRIFDHMEHDLGQISVKLENDGYWDVAEGERYDFAKKPESFDHGQLYDDWEFLSAILDDKDQAVSIMLAHVAPLLRYVGEKVGQ